MRIVFCPAAFAPAIGGSEAFTDGLAQAMLKRGAEVHVVVADISAAEAFFESGHTPTGLQPEDRVGDIAVHRIPLLPDRASRWDEKTRKRSRRRFGRNLAKVLAHLDPDVVVTLPHLFPNVEAVVQLRPGARWRLVYAPHLHEEDPWWPRDRVAVAVQRSDGIIALTAHERDRLVASYGANPARVAVVPPAVAVPPSFAGGRREPAVLFVGRRAASKRLDTLVDAMKIVWESEPGARLVVAGPAESGAIDALEPWRHDRRVEIHDAVSPPERSALISAARVMASASVIESFGITTLEAWAHGTPVVIADTPVARSIVQHGEDGLLAERSAAGMAEQLLVVLRDPDRAAAMGRAGRKRVAVEFTWERSGQALGELIEKL
jgi:glycosyltransferase involved in cell wall biosynthesis